MEDTNKTDFDKFKKDVRWLGTIILAFTERFDFMGQEHPLCGEQFVDMHETISYMHKTFNDHFTIGESQVLYPLLSIFEKSLINLIDLPRNATNDEVGQASIALAKIITSMSDILRNRGL